MNIKLAKHHIVVHIQWDLTEINDSELQMTHYMISSLSIDKPYYDKGWCLTFILYPVTLILRCSS